MKTQLVLFVLAIFLSGSVTTKEVKNAEVKSAFTDDILTLDELTEKIWNWKTLKGQTPWWRCGETIDAEESKKIAREWAYVSLSSIKKIEKETGYKLEPWGMVATMSRESAFDECALGLYPRLWAYEQNLLKKKRRHISHSREEIDKLVKNKKFMKKWPRLDLGPGQLMWRSVYKGKKEDLMSISPGIGLVAKEMSNRASRHLSRSNFARMMKYNGVVPSRKTPWWYKRPWSIWPGRPSKEYAKKIARRARALGAPREIVHQMMPK